MNQKIQILKENIRKKFTGNEKVIDNLIIVLLAGGHVLIEDVPGVGKTTLAKALAGSLEVSFARVQLTPDTLPTDITGTSIFNSKTAEFTVVKGPVHSQIFLADEINRTSPKTQSALLEAMEEHQVTIDGKTFPLPEPFMVIATQNPSEQIGTYPLPEAELDRFMMKLSVGYPAEEVTLAKRFLAGEMEESLSPVISQEEIIDIKNEVKNVIMSDELVEYAVTIVRNTRDLKELEYGLSPRSGLDLMMASKAKAYISGRDFVIPEDILSMSKVVLPHRLILTTEAKMNHYTPKQLIIDVINKVARPK